jgi:hypothetical protein
MSLEQVEHSGYADTDSQPHQRRLYPAGDQNIATEEAVFPARLTLYPAPAPVAVRMMPNWVRKAIMIEGDDPSSALPAFNTWLMAGEVATVTTNQVIADTPSNINRAAIQGGGQPAWGFLLCHA